MHQQEPSNWINSTWENTFRIAGVEFISQEPDSCLSGKRYVLRCQMNNWRQLNVESRKLL